MCTENSDKRIFAYGSIVALFVVAVGVTLIKIVPTYWWSYLPMAILVLCGSVLVGGFCWASIMLAGYEIEHYFGHHIRRLEQYLTNLFKGETNVK